MSDTNKERESVVIDFSQVGTAGPFPVVNGRVQVPDVTMLDLARMLKPTSDALAAPMPQSAGVTDEQLIACAKASTPFPAGMDAQHIAEFLPTWRKFADAVLALAPGIAPHQPQPEEPRSGSNVSPYFGSKQALVDWVAERWHAEVANRPLVNKNRRALDDCWRQMLRHLGVDDRARLGPTHDELLEASND